MSSARDFFKVLVLPALTFFLLPFCSVGFARYGEAKIDARILDSIEQAIARDASLDADARVEAMAFYRAHPPTSVCSDPAPELARYRQAVCKPGDEVWQFTWAERLSWWASGLGLLAFLLIAVVGVVALRRPGAQYTSFLFGWRSLQLIVAAETVLQAVLAVWLSYWVTALLMNIYAPKLILIVMVLAAVGVWSIVRSLFRRAPERGQVEAELVTETDAPALWDRIKALAGRLGTEPPRAVVAGIDDNFFVTEAGLELTTEQRLEGRVLYLSLPLLRVLSTSEADAVFGHELAHFHGGDTATSAKLAPALGRFALYVDSLAHGLTLPAALVMRLYRAVFEFGLAREQRRRELAADAHAARLTSADDVARSLLKVTGYSAFRAETERSLFEHRETHASALGLQARIDDGLRAHVSAQGFVDTMKTLQVPHPFDSHPPLEERLANVQTSVRVDAVATVFDSPPARTWADEVLTGGAIEQRLWAAYESRFKAHHELSLAYRYLPSNDVERALVERFFPEVRFEHKDGTVVVTHAGVRLPTGAGFAFRDVQTATVDDGNFSTQLVVKLTKASGGTETVKVNLRGFKPNAEAFKQAFGGYWQRDQAARETSP